MSLPANLSSVKYLHKTEVHVLAIISSHSRGRLPSLLQRIYLQSAFVKHYLIKYGHFTLSGHMPPFQCINDKNQESEFYEKRKGAYVY